MDFNKVATYNYLEVMIHSSGSKKGHHKYAANSAYKSAQARFFHKKGIWNAAVEVFVQEPGKEEERTEEGNKAFLVEELLKCKLHFSMDTASNSIVPFPASSGESTCDPQL